MKHGSFLPLGYVRGPVGVLSWRPCCLVFLMGLRPSVSDDDEEDHGGDEVGGGDDDDVMIVVMMMVVVV